MSNRCTTFSTTCCILRGGGDSDDVVETQEDHQYPTKTTKESVDEEDDDTDICIVRIRLPNGTIQRYAIPKRQLQLETMTVAQLLQSLGIAHAKTTTVPTTNYSITVKNPGLDEHRYDIHQTLSNLSISHGTLLTLSSITPKLKTKSIVSDQTKAGKTDDSSEQQQKRRFDPFPELARDYKTAQRKAQIARVRKSSSSFTDLSTLRDALHVVEPQTQGSIQRVYMCERSARSFFQNIIAAAAVSKGRPRPSYRTAAFLFGTITRERKETHPSRRPAKTSLSSSSREPEEYVSAVRVHAVYEPPTIMSSCTALSLENIPDRVFHVAGYLGMVPVGWIFSYDDDGQDATNEGTSKQTNDKEVPISKENIILASHLQIQNMKNKHNQNMESTSSSSFCWVTLAMKSASGETEAFQISDVTVQMAAEEMLLLTPDVSEVNADDPRHIRTKFPIIIDGKEIKTLDIVLCLINTAMLSHKGAYSGVQRGDSDTIVQAVKRRSGDLTTKTRKAILQALTSSSTGGNSNNNNKNDAAFFETVCEFSTLLALDCLLQPEESQKLCTLVRKWSRGQRQSTTLDETLKRRLLSILSTP